MAELIQCPKCGAEFEPTEALSEKLSARLRAELTAEVSRRQKELDSREQELAAAKDQLDAAVVKAVEAAREQLEKDAAKRAREASQAELDVLAKELGETRADLSTARKEKAELARRARELDDRAAAMDTELEERLEKERTRIAEAAKRKALAESESAAREQQDRLELLEAQLKERDARLAEARKAELALVKKEQELADRAAELEIQAQKLVAEKREEIRKAAREQLLQERLVKDREKDEQIEGLRKKIQELQQRAEQGSQQAQGEAQELVLEDMLRAAFPQDAIEPVAKGVHGGDVVQHVSDGAFGHCGLILWESKRTKNWSDGWLPKLRDDQRAAKAAQAVLVSQALPAGCDSFTNLDGVWVTGPATSMPLAAVLRQQLVHVAQAQRALQGQHGKMEAVYEYLSSTQFRNRVSGIVEALTSMRDDLEQEKRATFRLWAKREKQLERAGASSSGMYGDLEGIIGGALPELEALSASFLAAGAAGSRALGEGEEPGDGLEQAVRFLRLSGRPCGRADIVGGLGLDDAQWAALAPLLALDPRIRKLGQGRGTKYAWSAEVVE